MILQIRTKCVTDRRAPGLLPDFRAAVICTAFSPLVVGTGDAAQSVWRLGCGLDNRGIGAKF